MFAMVIKLKNTQLEWPTKIRQHKIGIFETENPTQIINCPTNIINENFPEMHKLSLLISKHTSFEQY
jgi:hypothetical protein